MRHRSRPPPLVRARRARPAAYTVYVSNERGNSITILDSETLEVVERGPGRPAPARHQPQPRRQVALHPRLGRQHRAGDGHRDAPDHPRRCPPAPTPSSACCDPSGNPLYVANEDDNLVTAIDVETRSIRAEIPVGIEPEGMGISPDGKVRGQHLRDHQHGAFHRHRDATRSSPTCWWTSARASPSSPATASCSTSRPRSAARSA